MRESRFYITDDCDLNKNRLEIFQGENGDWYIRTLKANERLENAVRITTSGGGKFGDKVALAVYKLWEALEMDERDKMTQEWKLK